MARARAALAARATTFSTAVRCRFHSSILYGSFSPCAGAAKSRTLLPSSSSESIMMGSQVSQSALAIAARAAGSVGRPVPSTDHAILVPQGDDPVGELPRRGEIGRVADTGAGGHREDLIDPILAG